MKKGHLGLKNSLIIVAAYLFALEIYERESNARTLYEVESRLGQAIMILERPRKGSLGADSLQAVKGEVG